MTNLQKLLIGITLWVVAGVICATVGFHGYKQWLAIIWVYIASRLESLLGEPK